MAEAPEKGYDDKKRERKILDVIYITCNRRKKVRDRDHTVMSHSKPLFSSCSGCIPAGWLHRIISLVGTAPQGLD